MKLSAIKSILLSTAVLAVSTPVRATVATWSATSGDILTGSNWTGGTAPKQSGDIGTISSGTAQVASGTAWAGTLNITNGGVINFAASTAGTAWSDVRLNDGAKVTGSAGSARGYWGSGSGSVTLTGKSVFDIVGTFTLNMNLTGTGGFTTKANSLRLAGSTLDFSGDARIEGGRIEVWSGSKGSMPNATIDMAGGQLRTHNLTDGIVTFGGLKGTTALQINNVADPALSKINEFRVGGNNQSTAFSGSIQSSGNGNANAIFVKQGTGTLTLSGANTYAGATRVDAGGLIIDGTHTGGDTITVKSDAWLGGNGTVGSSVLFEDGAKFAFSLTNALTVNGSTVDLGNLSVADLVGLNHADVTVGEMYTLIDGSANFIFDGVTNTTVETAQYIGGGKGAYFTADNDLQLHVVSIPEPAVLGLFVIGASSLLWYRHQVAR